MERKGFEMSFAWIFAIVIGGVIIFLAVYTTIRGIEVISLIEQTEQAAELGILLSPVSTTIESGRTAVIDFQRETRVINECDRFGTFGAQGIAISIKDLGDEWQPPGEIVSFKNKYIFSDKMEEGKKLYIYVRPFELPYKIADLVMAYSEKYCFVNPTSEIEDELGILSQKSVNITDARVLCPEESVSVCFPGDGCDISVSMQSQTVTKESGSVHFTGPLLFGAILSDPEIYECQVSRLMKRNKELAFVYGEKADYLDSQGCSNNLGIQIAQYGADSVLEDGEDSSKLLAVSSAAKTLENENSNRNCRVF